MPHRRAQPHRHRLRRGARHRDRRRRAAGGRRHHRSGTIAGRRDTLGRPSRPGPRTPRRGQARDDDPHRRGLLRARPGLQAGAGSGSLGLSTPPAQAGALDGVGAFLPLCIRSMQPAACALFGSGERILSVDGPLPFLGEPVSNAGTDPDGSPLAGTGHAHLSRC
nr:hypothetical protein [Methylobacterium sp. BTF04]